MRMLADQGIHPVSRILLCQAPDSQLGHLKPAIVQNKHQVVTSNGLDDLEQTTQLQGIDLMVIDATSSLDGAACCRIFGRTWPEVPIILLVGERTQVEPECKKLTGGNVLRLPFTPRKVTNRVNKLLNVNPANVLQVGEITLNVQKRCVYHGENYHRLTPKQAQLLHIFMKHAGRTLTRKFLMEEVWQTDYMGDTRTLDVHVRWLRERIERNPSDPRYLGTVRGIGYRFGVPEEGN